MSELRLLIVEDNERDLRSFRNSVKVYKNEKQRTIDAVECKNLEEALKTLDHSFDGAIIDVKLTNQGDEGNQVVEKIIESFFRIPIAIFTRNQGSWDDNLNQRIMLIDIFIKGKTEYSVILDKFWEIYDIGVTRIIGGRGLIEQRLSEVFLKNLQPQLSTWVSYGQENSERTEKALLRHILNHLIQFLEEDEKLCFPEEFYLYPSVLDRITTGSIVTADDQWFVVLSPACDLVPRGENDVLNTDRILLVEIESVEKILGGSKSKNRVSELSANRRTYYHWLPPTDFFQGGILNFRRLTTLDQDVFDGKFGKPTIQISPSFVKDIVSRFSSYYARQGQPDIDNKDFIDRYTT